MRPGLIYRSARTFSTSVVDVHDVFVNLLKIETVIDLRDRHLDPIPEEALSRLLVAECYPTHSVSTPLNDAPSTLPAHPTETRRVSLAAQAATQVDIARASALVTGPNDSSFTAEVARRMSRRAAAVREARPDLDERIVGALVTEERHLPICAMLCSGGKRQLAVVNVLE